jgi:hypothetical protein
MRVVVHSAAIQDRDGAGLILDKIRRRFPWLELFWDDCGYDAWQVEAAVAKVPLLRMEIIKRRHEGLRRPAAPLGGRAHLLLIRTRPASWAKDFRNLAETLVSFVILASIQPAGLRRLARA